MRHVLAAAAVLQPTRASSTRRFVARATAGLLHDAGIEALEERARDWARQPPTSERAALERLVGEDLLALLPEMPSAAKRIEGWGDPLTILSVAAARCRSALSKLGLNAAPSAVHLHDGLPSPYDHPSLAMVSIDPMDAAHFGLPPGLHVDRRRLWPLVSECTVGHVLLHAVIGSKSPEWLGRGFEEGACEVLGALHAACDAVGPEAAEAAFVATRLTSTLTPHRELFLGHARGAALLHETFGLDGLASLARSGRHALKTAEAALALGRHEELEIERSPRDEALSARLSRVLMARGRPQAVSPHAFLMARHVRAGTDAVQVAQEIGLPPEVARRAIVELMTPAFVALLDGDGRVLVDDLDLVLGAGTLRYDAG